MKAWKNLPKIEPPAESAIPACAMWAARIIFSEGMIETKHPEIIGKITFYEAPTGGLIASDLGEFIFDLHEVVGRNLPEIGKSCRFCPRINENPPRATEIEVE